MGKYTLNMPFATGDKVRYRHYLQNREPGQYEWREGVVEAIRDDVVAVYPGGRGLYITVPKAWVEAIVNTDKLVDHLIDRIRLIAAQEQACGGTVTPEECWRSAKTIAQDTLAVFGIAV